VAIGTGQLKKVFPAGATATYVLPVGDAANYTPVSLNITANSVPRTTGVRVTAAIHPQTLRVRIYFKILVFTDVGGGTYTYDASFTFIPADITGSYANLRVSRYNTALPGLNIIQRVFSNNYCNRSN